MKYKRILLKLSGESLIQEKQYGFNENKLFDYAKQIKEVSELGVQIAIVIGGGNIFRGVNGISKGFDRIEGDQIGMLATVINSLALSSALKKEGIEVKMFTSIKMDSIGYFYFKEDVIDALNKKKVVILSGGTGNPFFTTDTASVLRAIELNADIMLKGTHVNGVYDTDPKKNPKAVKFDRTSYDEIYNKDLKIIDLTAAALAKSNHLQMIVFNMNIIGNLKKILYNKKIGTLITI
ncbi:MAG: UMP kinase [Bacteroidales bacterium OttesenSCG-928-I14]|jgi:uridylate kinase|nr:UMP kinase [Bacteroidales bacterium OttesenSCG-928-I14]